MPTAGATGLEAQARDRDVDRAFDLDLDSADADPEAVGDRPARQHLRRHARLGRTARGADEDGDSEETDHENGGRDQSCSFQLRMHARTSFVGGGST
jgi:hypothetical protein